jgi:hypothetical protein
MKILFLIIFGLTSSLISGQSRCDTLQKEIWVATKEPPRPSVSYDQLVLILNKTIDLSNYDAPKENIYINFIINCKGEDFDYKSIKPIDSRLMEAIVKTFRSNLTWIPAKHNKQNVDFGQTLTIKIENGIFRELSDSNGTKKR